MTIRRTSAALLLAIPIAAAAAQVECYEEPGTRKHTCVDPKEVTVNGDTRAAPIYSGGPNGVKKQPYLVVVNCSKGVATLQDASGVNFAGGTTAATPAMRTLSDIVCSAANPKKAPKLKQF